MFDEAQIERYIKDYYDIEIPTDEECAAYFKLSRSEFDEKMKRLARRLSERLKFDVGEK